MSKPPSLKSIDLDKRLADAGEYQDKLKTLQTKLALLQTACFHNHHRVVIVLEGWDASGKGGAIRRMTEKLDPRSYRVHPIGKPSDTELQQHYLQRFWDKLPAKGNIAIFDRSWYGRVLVERVEELATVSEWQRAYGEISEFERQLHDDGVVIIKLFLHISQDEQLKRYLERLDNPLKNWKLTAEDLRNRARAEDYRSAFEDMLENTSSDFAPWHLIPGNHKWYARTEVFQRVVQTLEKTIDIQIPHHSASEIRAARKALGVTSAKSAKGKKNGN